MSALHPGILALIAALVLPTAVNAQAACPSSAVDCVGAPLTFEATAGRGGGLDVDTGWFPGNLPVQLRAIVRVDGTTTVRLASDALARWPAPVTMDLGRSSNDGLFAFDYGLVISLKIRVDLTVLGTHIGGEWDIPIPNLPSDLSFSASQPLSDLVLPNDAASAVTLRDSIASIPIVKYDALQAVLPIPGLSGAIVLAAQGSLESTYRTDRVVVSNGDALLGTGESALFSPADASGYGADLVATVEPEGTLEQRFVITLKPQLHVSFFGVVSYDIDIASLPIDLPARQRTMDFSATTATFPLPDAVVRTTQFEFEPTLVGERSDRLVEIRNEGHRTLFVEVDEISDGFMSPASSRTVPPSSSARLLVHFEPTEVGITTGFVDLLTNDPDQPLIRVTLTGEGLAPPEPMMTDAGVYEPGDAGAGPAAVGGGCSCTVGRSSRPGSTSRAFGAAFALLLIARSRRRTA